MGRCRCTGHATIARLTADLTTLRERLAAAEAKAERLERALRSIDIKGMTSSRSWITDIARDALTTPAPGEPA